MTGILIAAAIVGGVGLFIGVFLGVAEKQFAVEVDEREEAITGVLPGNNCGRGRAGCRESRSDHGSGRRRDDKDGCFCEMCRYMRKGKRKL